jgi:hypothetical protein
MSAGAPSAVRSERTLDPYSYIALQTDYSGVVAMDWKMIATVIAWPLIGMPAVTLAQGAPQTQAIADSDVLSQISMFAYQEGPESDLFFRGTPLAALAEGQAQVEYQDGNARISAKVRNLPEPASLGPYTTYILWALTPDGRPVNQGVIAGSEGGRGRLDTQYGASQFALIITAEPHFAVSAPSSMIVLYNVDDDVKGEDSKVATLTERADYSNLARIAIDDKMSTPEIVQAQYAVAIAGAAGAERFAAQTSWRPPKQHCWGKEASAELRQGLRGRP